MHDIHTHTYTHKYIYIHTFIYLYNHLFISLSWSCLKNFIRFLFETHFSASFLICSFTCALTCCLYLPLFLPLPHFASSFLHSLIFADSPWLDLTWVSASGMARFNFIVLQNEGKRRENETHWGAKQNQYVEPLLRRLPRCFLLRFACLKLPQSENVSGGQGGSESELR